MNTFYLDTMALLRKEMGLANVMEWFLSHPRMNVMELPRPPGIDGETGEYQPMKITISDPQQAIEFKLTWGEFILSND